MLFDDLFRNAVELRIDLAGVRIEHQCVLREYRIAMSQSSDLQQWIREQCDFAVSFVGLKALSCYFTNLE